MINIIGGINYSFADIYLLLSQLIIVRVICSILLEILPNYSMKKNIKISYSVIYNFCLYKIVLN